MRSLKKSGLTLVELLVTLGVVMLLASLILPTVKNLLVDRKSTQSATVVRNFIESARARAIGTNSTVSVILERVSSIPLDVNEDGVFDSNDLIGNGTTVPYRFQSGTAQDPLPNGADRQTANFVTYNMCVRMSLGERPKPRHSSMLSMPTLTVAIHSPHVAGSRSAITAALGSAHPAQGYFYVQVPGMTPAEQLLAYQQLDLLPFCDISLGTESARYTVAQIAGPHATGLWMACVDSNGISKDSELVIPALTPKNSFGEFTVYPKPRPISNQTVSLPKGMCIDLSLSGFGEVGSLSNLDRRYRFSSDWVGSQLGAAPSPEVLRPVYLEFGPDGLLKTVWANGTGSNKEFLVPSQILDDVYLHIGKNDQILFPAMPTTSDAILPNLADASSYVVRVSAKSGAISAAPLASYETQSELTGISADSPGNILSLGRLGVLGQPVSGQ